MKQWSGQNGLSISLNQKTSFSFLVDVEENRIFLILPFHRTPRLGWVVRDKRQVFPHSERDQKHLEASFDSFAIDHQSSEGLNDTLLISRPVDPFDMDGSSKG